MFKIVYQVIIDICQAFVGGLMDDGTIDHQEVSSLEGVLLHQISVKRH